MRINRIYRILINYMCTMFDWNSKCVYFEVGTDDMAGGDSSKSNSIASDRSIQSVGVSASSQSSSTNSIPPMHDPDDPTNHFSPLSMRPRARASIVRKCQYLDYSYLMYLLVQIRLIYYYFSTVQASSYSSSAERIPNNFATIRTTSIVTKQQKEHMQEDMYEQMSGYKRMRREHQGALLKVGFWNQQVVLTSQF